MSFTATHVVPASGLPTWPSPDPSLPQGPRLASGLDVQLLEVTPEGWARVACSNGWTAWVDARRLAAPVLASGSAAVQLAPPVTRRKAVRLAWRAPVVLGGLAVAGAALMALASALPWFSAGGESASGWDVGLSWVVFGTGDGRSGVRLGLPLVIAGGIVAVLAVARRQVRLPVAIALAAAGSWSATFAASRVLRPEPHPEIGIGAVVAFVGAALVAGDVYRGIRRLERRQ